MMSAAVRKTRVLRSMSWADRALVIEAACMLAAARVILLLIPFRWLQRWLTLSASDEAAPDAAVVDRVRHAVDAAARNVPFKAVCLPQAMAAKAMLARRGVRSSLCIGAARDDRGEMMLHAWLEAGGTTVTGYAGAAVTPVARFG